MNNKSLWFGFFVVLVLFYGLLYAPYGINETDGGFLTGLAWQLASGKTLYSEVLYVRPPVPVWLHRMELALLPENWAILGERWIFYLKIALYSSLGAGIWFSGTRRWQLAALAFVLSVHAYPAASWHTVDGILMAVFALYFFAKKQTGWILTGGLFLAWSILSKQSFYPLIILPLLLLPMLKQKGLLASYFGLMLGFASCLIPIYWMGTLDDFWLLSRASAGAGAAVQHGLVDYLHIHPVVLAGFAVLGFLPLRSRFFDRDKHPKLSFLSWLAFLGLLVLSFIWQLHSRQDFTLPFAQTRMLFLFSAGYLVWAVWKKHWSMERACLFAALLAIDWCSAISWGYNLPILFFLPLLIPVWELSTVLWNRTEWQMNSGIFPMLTVLAFVSLFRYAYSFVYRDGLRSEMHAELGAVYPKLSGIISNKNTFDLYRDLRDLQVLYPNSIVLPHFPLADYLADKKPILALDWVVKREMGGREALVYKQLLENKPVILIETSWLTDIETEPEYELVREVIAQYNKMEQTAYFTVYKMNDE
jgi:hypothetical protein